MRPVHRHVLATLVLLAVARPAVAATINITANVPDVNVTHTIFTNGIDKGGAGTESTLGPGATDTWNLTFTNTSAKNWTDFHIEMAGNVPVNQIHSGFLVNTKPVVTMGFGAPANIEFVVSDLFAGGGLGQLGKKADMTQATVAVAPGGMVKITVTVGNSSGVFANDYHLKIRATDTAPLVPEPGPLLLLMAGVAALRIALRVG